jgi:hypothetical protein
VGIFNLIIGAGVVLSDSLAPIDWSNDNYFLKEGLDASGGSTFLTMGNNAITERALCDVCQKCRNCEWKFRNGNQIMERGIVYLTTPNPTINSNKIIIENGIGAFDTISACV